MRRSQRIFRLLPAEHSLFFIACDLTSLFKSTLSLYSRAELPTPSTQKTQALVIWILKTQDLPSTILGADVVRFEIVRVLRDVLSGGEQSEKMIGDAFEVSHAIYWNAQ